MFSLHAVRKAIAKRRVLSVFVILLDRDEIADWIFSPPGRANILIYIVLLRSKRFSDPFSYPYYHERLDVSKLHSLELRRLQPAGNRMSMLGLLPSALMAHTLVGLLVHAANFTLQSSNHCCSYACSFFTAHVINIWNRLPDSVDFGSISLYRRVHF